MGLLQNIANGAKTLATTLAARNIVKTNQLINSAKNTFNNIKETYGPKISDWYEDLKNSTTSAPTSAEDIWEKGNQFNHDEAEIQRNWEEKMDNTKYQRMVKDLIAAGINPILAAQLGAGSVPGGASASATGYKDTETKLDKQLGYLSQISTICANFASGRQTKSSAFGQKQIIEILKEIKYKI